MCHRVHKVHWQHIPYQSRAAVYVCGHWHTAFQGFFLLYWLYCCIGFFVVFVCLYWCGGFASFCCYFVIFFKFHSARMQEQYRSLDSNPQDSDWLLCHFQIQSLTFPNLYPYPQFRTVVGYWSWIKAKSNPEDILGN